MVVFSSFDKCPKDEKGAMDMKDIQKYKKTFMSCIKWLKENYQPACEGFLNEVETK